MMTTRTGKSLVLKWMVLLTLFTILPLIIAGLSIVQIYHEDLKGSFIAVEGIALIVGILFSFFLARKLILPIKPLSKETGEVAKGNQHNHIEPATEDGVEVLTEPFDHMIRDLGQSKGASKEGKEQYWRIFENSKDTVYITSADGKIIDINQAGIEMLGYGSKEELIKLHPKDFYFSSTERKRYINEVARNGFVKNFETKLKRKDGAPIDVLMTVNVRRDASGNTVGYEGFIKDISDRKRMEEELRKSEERYRTILENIQEAYYEIDLAGNLTFVNDTMCRDLGYSREELIGMNYRRYEDEATAKKMYQLYSGVYRTGEPIKVLDAEIIRKDGTKGTYELSASLIRDAQGKPIGLRGITRDVTERKQAEEALRRSEERYRDILESIQDGYFEVDLAGKSTFFNDVVPERLGYSKEEFLGISYRQFTDEENARKLFKNYNALYRTGQPIKPFEVEYIRKDGSKTVSELSISLMKDPAGKPIGFRVTTRDVTERKRVEEALRQSEERYRTIIESIEDGYYEEDLAGNFVFFNEAMCRIYGYPKEELLGLNYKKYTSEETAKRLFQIFGEMYRTGNPIKEHSYELIRKDGVKRYIEASASLKRDPSGKPIGFRGVVRDVTERKRAEEALRQSEERYRTILETIEDGYFEDDLAGNLVFVNDALCRGLGYTQEELIGMNYRQFTDETTAKKMYQVYNGIYRTGKPINAVEGEYFRKDGAKGTYEVSVSLIRDSEGKPIGFRGISRDITERKRAEEALRQSEEKYRTIIESIQDNYFEVDLAGNLTFVNDAICRHLGYSREELIGMNYRQYTNPKTTKQVSQAYSELCRTGEPIKGLYGEVIRKNGTKLIHEASVSLIRDSEGKPIGFRGTSRDVTERKRMEDALRESENKFRSLVENSVVGVYLIQDGIFKYVNSRVADISGYKIEEMVDKMGPKQSVLPEDLSIVEGNIDKRIKGEEGSVHYEFRTVTKSQEIRNVEVFGSRTMYQGRPAVIGTMLDITDRKKAEEALRQSEEKYRTILENIEDGYYELDLAGNFTFFNDSICRIFGYPKEELMGMNNRQYMNEENAKKVSQAYNKVYRTGEPGRVFDWEIIRKDGTKRYVEASTSLKKDSSGKPIGFRGISRDITERKRAEEALRQSEETAKRLAQENAIVAEIGRIVSSTLNIDEVYERFAEAFRKILPFDRVVVTVVNPNHNFATLAYVFGVEVGSRQVGTRVTSDSGVIAKIILQRSSILIQTEDESEVAESYPGFLDVFRAGFRSLMAVPMTSKDQVIAIFHIHSLKPNAYTESDVMLAERVSAQIAGAIANAQLFAERKQAEEALRQSEERYRTIIERIEEGYYEVDLAGNFTFLNDSMCRIWGYPKEELMGMNNRQYTDKASAKKVFEYFNQVYRTGEPGRVIAYEIIRKDGTKRYIETSFSLIKDSSGKPMAFRGILRDITERKQMEEALQKSEEKYRTILESIQEAYFEDDLSGNLTFFNNVLCRHFGYTREELIGMNYLQRVDEKDARKLRQFYSELHRTGEPIKALEAEFVRKDGTKLIAEFSASLIRNSEGKPIGFRGISRDITERKKIEEQLFQAEKLRAVGEMASGVAHDFNNALTAILGNTQLLLYTTHDGELKETLRIIEKVAKDTSQTVRRLQDFTRKRVDQKLFRVDVNSIIKDSIEMTKPKWKDEPQSRGIRIEMVSNLEEIPSVSGSASELGEVITNMIFNAIEAMPEGGKIEIRTFKERREVFIQISDAGIGIAEEVKRKIFEPFFTTKPFTNAGLGLSMSYGIIKRFGGEIEVESKAGQGTTFTIILPMGGEEEEPVSPQTIKKGRKACILVIDDDEFVRSVLSRALAQANHQVTLAENGEKGVQLFKKGKFDIVLTDLGMPGMSGWEVCRTIKEISPHTPVGMITGWGEEMSQSKMGESGLDFLISKPFDLNQILNVIVEIMESKEE